MQTSPVPLDTCTGFVISKRRNDLAAQLCKALTEYEVASQGSVLPGDLQHFYVGNMPGDPLYAASTDEMLQTHAWECEHPERSLEHFHVLWQGYASSREAALEAARGRP
jgi:hypothetical protein